MKQRYGKAVLAVCLLIIGVFTYGGHEYTQRWEKLYDRTSTDQFEEEFLSGSDDFAYWDEEKGETVYYTDAKSYRAAMLPLFRTSGKRNFSKSYQSSNRYFWNSRMPEIIFPAILFLFIGFAAFFIDLKTSFNQFLFSSGVSRKKLFAGKTLFIGLSAVLAFIAGNLVLLAFLYARIPHMYINAPLWVLLISIARAALSACYYFAAGSFLGVLLGNMIFGPVTIGLFFFMSVWLPNAVAELLSTVQGLLYGYDHITPSSAQRFFLEFMSKDTGTWQSWVLFFILTAVLLFAALKAYQKISLEENDNYLLIRSWRLPVMLLMGSICSFFAVTIFDNPLMRYIYASVHNPGLQLSTYAIEFVLIILVCFLICWMIVYFSDIKKHFMTLRGKRKGKLA